MASRKIHVVIGTSAAGIGAVTQLRALDPHAQITWISDEAEIPYNKCLLAGFLDNSKELSQLFTRDIAYIQQQGIELLLGTRVISIDAQARTVKLNSGKKIFYDRLLIATGTRIKNLEVSGSDLQGVFNYQTLADAVHIKKYVQKHAVDPTTLPTSPRLCRTRKLRRARKAVIVGAGLSGLECADALHSLGCEVTVVEAQQHLLPTILDKQGSDFLINKIEQSGVTTYLGQQITEIIQDNESTLRLQLSSGAQFQVDMIVCALGTQPNSEIAKSANIKLCNNFIIVDEFQRTSQEHIFAAGDVTVVRNQLTGELVPTNRWSDAVQQGMVAGSNMAGVVKKYSGIIPRSSSSFFGVRFFAGGACVNTGQNAKLSVQLAADFLEVMQHEPFGFYVLSCRPIDVSVYKNMLVKNRKD